MSKKYDGGPAFPRGPVHVKPDNDRDYVIPGNSGMTLRDWFAGQALARLVSGDGPQLETWEHVAAAAYDAADAMLKARASEASHD